MIVPSKKLKQAVALYESQETFCERVGIDATILSKWLNGERGASAGQIEKVCRHFGWALNEAWEIVEGNTNE